MKTIDIVWIGRYQNRTIEEGVQLPPKALGDVPIWHRFTTEDELESGNGGPDLILTTVVFVWFGDHVTGAPLID